jgi:hypothetical protein
MSQITEKIKFEIYYILILCDGPSMLCIKIAIAALLVDTVKKNQEKNLEKDYKLL